MTSRGRRAFGLAAVLLAGLGRAALAETVEIRVLPTSPVDQPVPVTVQLSQVGSFGAERPAGKEEPKSFQTEAPGTVRVDIEPGGIWEAQASGEGFWSPRVTLGAASGESGQNWVLRLWPAARLTGRLKLGNPAEHLPTTIQARFESPAPGGTLPRTASDCGVTDGAFVCTLPGDLALDVRLRAIGFVSHYLWSFAIPAGEVHDLGALELKRGGSLVGWVEVVGPAPVEECVVELAPTRAGPGYGRDDRFERLAHRTKPMPSGFFSFEALPPGSYTLTANHSRLAPMSVSPIHVDENKETELTLPVTLAPPLTLQVLLDPPHDVQGGDWRLALLRYGSRPGLLEPVEATPNRSEAGLWTRTGLTQGRYVVQVADSEGVVFAAEEFDLDQDFPPLRIALGLTPVEGVVTLAGEPLWAALTFREDRGPVRIRTESDPEGSFAAVLPRDGEWDVEVESEDPDVHRRVRRVPVVVRPERGAAWVELELPGTVLAGEVIDQSGRPVEGAQVIVAPEPLTGRPSRAMTRERGRFSLRGLEPGSYLAQASALREGRSLASAQQAVRLDEGLEPEVVLVLRPRRTVAGRVVTEAGAAVAGAWLLASPNAGGAALLLDGTDAETGPDGGFEVDLPAESTAVQLDVFPPGFAHRQLLAPLDGSEVLVVVDRHGGTLVLELPDEPVPWLDWSAPKPIIFSHETGLGMAANAFVRWAQINGIAGQDDRRWTLPMLAPGRYSVCMAYPWQVQPGAGRLTAAGPCDEGFLPPEGMLELRVSAAPARRDRPPARPDER